MNSIGRTVVGHGQDRNLGDGAVTALDTARALVDGRQIRVHVTRVSAATRHFFTCSGDFTEGVAVGCHVGQDDEDVLLELVSVVLGGGEGEARRDDAFDAGRTSQHTNGRLLWKVRRT